MPDGEPDTVIVLSGSTNRLRYADLGSGQFAAAAGVYSTLAQGTGVYTQTLRDQTRYVFDDTTGQLLTLVDPLGRAVTLTYDSNTPPQLTQITDANDSSRVMPPAI
jgi:YD repeat-containing protein